MYGGGLATALGRGRLQRAATASGYGEQLRRAATASGYGARLQRAGREARRRVAVRQRQHRARQRLLLLAVALPAALRDGHGAAQDTRYWTSSYWLRQAYRDH